MLVLFYQVSLVTVLVGGYRWDSRYKTVEIKERELILTNAKCVSCAGREEIGTVYKPHKA